MPESHAIARSLPAGLQPEDVVACQGILGAGSKSFAAASLLLPARVREPAAVCYAFCRVADDAVDEGDDVDAAVAGLHARLDRIYRGQPDDDPVDRSLAVVVRDHELPEAVLRALLEGFAWDAEGRRYRTLDELEAYCARVASTVGVIMTLLMGSRDPDVLARACDLGLAMQLTNIARDVGEDARSGRVYLPLDWLAEAGLDVDELLREPRFSPALGQMVQRLLDVADGYYRRADLGIRQLPRDSRTAIRAARLIYSDIGRVIAHHQFDSVSQRAYTSKARKLWLLLRASAATLWFRRRCDEPARPAVRFLVDAAADRTGSARAVVVAS
ncbi:MAG: phytoene/squalene synthase family protein [Pseudomonadota bacterium]